jgi:hypothetical protein
MRWARLDSTVNLGFFVKDEADFADLEFGLVALNELGIAFEEYRPEIRNISVEEMSEDSSEHGWTS